MFKIIKVIYMIVFSLILVFVVGLVIKYNIMNSPPICFKARIIVPGKVELNEEPVLKTKSEIFPPWKTVDISYDTNNHEIATIDSNGVLHPKKEGNITITAKALDKDLVSETISIRDTKVIDIMLDTTGSKVYGEITCILGFQDDEFVNGGPSVIMNYPDAQAPELELEIEDKDIAYIQNGYQIIGTSVGRTNLIARAGDFTKEVPINVILTTQLGEN